jgi:hypothetical protein
VGQQAGQIAPEGSRRALDDKPKWDREYFALEFPLVATSSGAPDQKVLLNLIEMVRLRVAKSQRRPRTLTEQQHQDVHARLKMGEPRPQVARAYDLEIDELELLAPRG